MLIVNRPLRFHICTQLRFSRCLGFRVFQHSLLQNIESAQLSYCVGHDLETGLPTRKASLCSWASLSNPSFEQHQTSFLREVQCNSNGLFYVHVKDEIHKFLLKFLGT